MINLKKMSLLCLLILALVNCSFVDLDPQARDVAVSTDVSSLKNCKFLGNTNVSLWSNASTFQSDEKVTNQLDTLARNQAAAIGGNMVILNSKVIDNQATYSVYKCTDHDANHDNM